MLLATIAFAQLLRTCAPNVNPRTMTAVVRVESGGNRLALHDNTLRRSFSPVDDTEAVAWASQLVGMGHSVDIGLSQINSANLPRLGLSVSDAFDPCTNLRAGATILGEDYASAEARFGPGQMALRRALGAYNTGSLFAGQTYVNAILVAAGLAPDDAGPPATVADRRPPSPNSGSPTSSIVVYGSTQSYATRRVAGSSVEVILGNR
jgi:type IV secretion system protein VirB1